MGCTNFQVASGNVLAQLTLTTSVPTTESTSTEVSVRMLPLSATESTSTKVVAFPTDSKVREQEARRAATAAGHEVVKVKQKEVRTRPH